MAQIEAVIEKYSTPIAYRSWQEKSGLHSEIAELRVWLLSSVPRMFEEDLAIVCINESINNKLINFLGGRRIIVL